MKRHQILGRELRDSVQNILSLLAKGEASDLQFIGPGKPHQRFARAMQFENAVTYVVMEHLGYGPIPDLKSRIHTSVDRAVDYFFGDWWRGDESDAQALDKSRPDRMLTWFEVLPHALLLGGLAGRWDDVAKICSWFDASIEIEYQAGQVEDQYQQLFLCIASSLSPQPMPGVEQLVANVKKCRTKRPKLLCAVWDAAIAKDQKAFDKALSESVNHFLKVDGDDAPNPSFWVALHPSIVWLIAEKNGLTFPASSEKLDAAIVRRQTIGLA